MENASGKTDLTDTSKFMGYFYPVMLLIFYLRFMIDYCKSDQDKFDAKLVMGLNLGATLCGLYNLAELIVAFINYLRLNWQSSALESWHASEGCVASDPYMQVSEYEFTSMQNISDGATMSLLLCSAAVLAQLAFLTTGYCYVYKMGGFDD